VTTRSQFVGMHANPTTQAFAETSVVLGAYMEALSSLMAIVEQQPEVDHIVEGMYSNYVTLKELRSSIDENLQKADVMLEAIGAKLAL